MAEYDVITDAAGLAAAADALAAGTGPVAVDVERASGFRYSQRAYLIQVYRRGAGVFLVDPPAVGDLSPLQEAIGDITWILHAASQDLPSLREENLEPPQIFDTELAARLLGHERVGLGAVVEDTLGITLAKAHSAADWSTRPLPQPWLEYAALDVLHLVDVFEVLRDELEEQGKTDIAAQEFETVRTRPVKPPREEPWRRLSGLHTVRGRRALAIARALWIAREEYAREQDTSPGRLVPDRALVAVVIADPKTKQDLARVKDFTGRASRSQLDRWWAAIEAGRADPALPAERASGDGMPPPRAWAERNPAADLRLKAARPLVEQLAVDLRMPTENLLTPDTLRRVAWAPPAEIDAASIGEALAAHGARPWQIETTARVIAGAFVESVQTTEAASDLAS
ncbi:MAG: ribonuclease D [Microbacterium sp. 69-7]|uniref:ribonuclease D n=1 Tax=Microbacterium sp. 69-7 TaxID=1895784 RepID=UPI0002588A99|nr:HRDC domain-containing protein [Microbacterium sp. 69-7]EIC08648.1 3'-5' exonuclease [Microbacterium laevaniformans OR221]OJU43684.1 MAG: ribonuclease D [Microbacterium sp. 69-7]